MYQLMRTLTIPQFLTRQVPALVASIVIAEVFYKFHSFTLECVAFLATWFALDAVTQGLATLWRAGRSPKTDMAN
jgi:hypothetical protein